MDENVKVLFLDPAGGIAGDMVLAGVTGLGFDPAPVQSALNAAGVDVTITPEPRTIKGIAGFGVRIAYAPDQPLRHLADLTNIVDACGAPQSVAKRANAALTRLAQVEAAVHGATLESVHFHEVGGIDSMVDIIGTFICIEQLGITRVHASTVPLGSGFIDCAHGRIPVPVPATLAILEGIPVTGSDATTEIVTPKIGRAHV